MDILEFRSKSFLIVVDFYSHFPELRLLKQKRSEDVVAALKSIFAVHGVPADIVADNMPFSSQSMLHFAQEWGFKVTTSSPHYPRSNGMSERYVQTIKQFLKKAGDSEDDLYAALLAYRQTPVTGLKFSPAELLFNRYIRGPLPLTTNKLTPNVPQEAFEQLKGRQVKQKQAHDARAKPLPPLTPGTAVYVRTNKETEWKPGTVTELHPQPRSYIIDNDTSQVRRNRVHLKPNRSGDKSSEVHEPPLVINDGQPSTSEAAAEDIPNHPTTPRRSARSNKGATPSHLSDYVLN